MAHVLDRLREMMASISITALLVFTYVSTFITSLGRSPQMSYSIEATIPRTPELDLPENVAHSLAQYSPFYAAAKYTTPPEGCVNILERHGARYPTTSAGSKISSTVSKLSAATSITDPNLLFVKNYTYDLGANDLVPFGAAQSFDSGQLTYARYKYLLSPTSLPFIRASSSQRVVDSSTNFSQGITHASSLSSPKYTPRKLVLPSPLIISESGNDTLEDHMCPAAGSSDIFDAKWLSAFAPNITARLNSHLLVSGNQSINLTNDDTMNLMQLCAFDTVAHARASPFCDVFSEEEWGFFEYSGDVDKFYNTGYGQPLGPVQGVGYINELLARITQNRSYVLHDTTQTNRTLSVSPLTFPLNRTIYVDFSHDNEMIPIFAAMGLFKQSMNLGVNDIKDMDASRTWVVSKMVPFSGRFVLERMSCGKQSGSPDSKTKDVTEKIRILVSDVVQPLEFCNHGAVGEDQFLCTVDAFVESQGYARENGRGDFEKCFETG